MKEFLLFVVAVFSPDFPKAEYSIYIFRSYVGSMALIDVLNQPKENEGITTFLSVAPSLKI